MRRAVRGWTGILLNISFQVSLPVITHRLAAAYGLSRDKLQKHRDGQQENRDRQPHFSVKLPEKEAGKRTPDFDHVQTPARAQGPPARHTNDEHETAMSIVG